MKKKAIFWMLIAGMLTVAIVLTACTTGIVELIDGKPVMKHEYDALGFENCFACHTGGLYPVPEEYAEMPIDLCSSPACHITMGTTPPTTTATTTPTTTATTTPTTTATTTPTTTATTTPTTTTGAAEPPTITAEGHDLYATLGGLCRTCHGPGMGEEEFPIGGPNDHTDRTNEECLDCHELAVP